MQETQSVKEFKQEFVNIFVNKLGEILQPFEDKRASILRQCIICSILCLIVSAFTIWLLSISESFGPFDRLIALPFFLALLLGFMPSCIAKEFENDIKKKLMPIILRCLHTFKWTNCDTISNEYIRKIQLFDVFNQRTTDDNFEGEYNGVKINISETELGYETGSGKNRTYTTRFKGVLISLDIEKNYQGQTFILEKSLFGTTRKVKISDNKLANTLSTPPEVFLEDIKFKKKFAVFSSDQIEARYILTPAFMERFNSLRFAFHASRMEAGIKDNKILIALYTGKDLFRIANLFRPICDYKQLKKMADEFACLLELIDELKLDVNIGL